MGQLQAACGASGASWWRTKCASAVSLLSKKMAAFQAQLLCLPPNALHPAAGQEECESAVSLLEEDARRLRRVQGTLRLMPVPLYAGLPAAHQLEVFEPSPRGYRKVGQATSRKLQQGRSAHRAPGSSPGLCNLCSVAVRVPPCNRVP